VCGKESDPAALLRAAEAEASAGEEDAAQAEALEVLRERVEAIQEVERELAPLESGIEGDERTVSEAHEEFAQVLDLNQAAVTVEEARASVAQLTEDVDALDLRIVDGEAAKDRAIRRIRDLQVEGKYHDLRDRATHLEWFLDTGMEDARSLLRDYRSLLDTTRHLRALLEREFRKALDRAIPVLDDMFTDVYRRLTRQSSYDLVRVYHDPERAGALELRVASGRLPGQSFPANVLNGQASKALHLVPYFVFSRFQPALMELDLLLIDDPSESFDTSHVGMLVDQLAQAAQHAQLVVASHEEEKFESYLAERFKEDPYLEVRVTGFDPLTGPELAAN